MSQFGAIGSGQGTGRQRPGNPYANSSPTYANRQHDTSPPSWSQRAQNRASTFFAGMMSGGPHHTPPPRRQIDQSQNLHVDPYGYGAGAGSSGKGSGRGGGGSGLRSLIGVKPKVPAPKTKGSRPGRNTYRGRGIFGIAPLLGGAGSLAQANKNQFF